MTPHCLIATPLEFNCLAELRAFPPASITRFAIWAMSVRSVSINRKLVQHTPAAALDAAFSH
jgi:hypothetical protein